MNSGEVARLLANLIKQGFIHSIDETVPAVRVQIGANTTDWLRFFVPAAGDISTGRFPSVGETCVVLSEGGDLGCGVVLCGVSSNQFPAPSNNPDEHVTKYKDGAVFMYNQKAGQLKISGVKDVNITAQTSVITCPKNTIKGDLNLDGALIVTKSITGQGGMAISGSAAGSGGASATFTGDIRHSGGTIYSTSVIQDGHKHNVLGVGTLTGLPT